MKLFSFLVSTMVFLSPLLVSAGQLNKWEGFELIMKCKDPVTSKEVVQVVDFSSTTDKNYLVEYIGDDGEVGSLLVSTRVNDNFVTKPGSNVKMELTKIDENKFHFYACFVNIDSSCMHTYVAPVDLVCEL